MSDVPPLTDERRRFLRLHVLAVPAAWALAAYAVRAAGLDDSLAAAGFDPLTARFVARDWALLELLGHRLAKSAVAGLWCLLFAAALWLQVTRHAARGLLWSTVVGMALGPLVVVALKDLNAIHCPWDLKHYGGLADPSHRWFVPPVDAGHCFPGGHAAGGFSLVALGFAGHFAGVPRWRRAGFAAALLAGFAFSAVRVAQGAHFLSHNLWSAAIDWCCAALAFAAFLPERP